MSRPQKGAPNQGWAARLSPLIAAAGVVAVPALLIRHQGRLGITNAELVYLLHVLSHRWDGDTWPWVAVERVASAAAVHETVARRWKASLEAKGFVTARARVIPGIGRRADEHDLSGLFAALERLAEEEETQKALDRVRGDLPQPSFARPGMADVPQLSTPRPRKIARRRASENAQAGASKIVAPPRAKTRGAARAKLLPEIEAGPPEPTTRSIVKNPPYPEATYDRAAATRPGENQSGQTDARSAQERDAMREGTYDDGIRYYLETYSQEFQDDDPPRTLETVHHLWWNADVPAEAAHAALKLAYYSTRSLHKRGAIQRPMAYFCVAFKTALEDQRVRLGLKRAG